MTNETASCGKPVEFTELTKLRPMKSVSVFGYVHRIAYAFNKDHFGKPQHEICLSLTDSKTTRPVPFSLFRGTDDDDAFRGQLREGILGRVLRTKCRKTDGVTWLVGRAGAAGMHVVGFELSNVLDVVCTTSAAFPFTQLHHDKLNELQRHFLQRDNVTESMSDAFTFRSRPIARIVQDETNATSVTYAIEAVDEPLTHGPSPPPLVIQLEEDEPASKENVAIVDLTSTGLPPAVITSEGDNEESEEIATAVNLRPMRLALNPVVGQVSEGGAPRCISTLFAEVVHDTLIPPAAVSAHPQPPAPPKRPRMERSYVVPPPGPHFRNRQTLRSAQQLSYFDCVCEVVGVVPDNGDHVILRVWDGTKPSRSLARCDLAKPITADSELEASVNDYVVDIVCWDEHAESAKRLKPHDKVSIVNVHAYVNKANVEAYTMHRGVVYGRAIRLLRNPQLIEQLERQLSAVPGRPSKRSQGISDDESFDNEIGGAAASTHGRPPGIFRA